MKHYENVLRPNYEFWAFWVWLAGGLAVYLMYRRLDLPVLPFQVMGILCAGMALGRGLAAFQRWREMQRLLETPKEFISWRDLAPKSCNGMVWLGRGFAWTPQEIQKAWEISKSSDSRLLQKSRGHWIHGVGLRNQDIRISPDLLQGHTLVVGSTGTGKTRLFDLLILQAIARGETVIIIDPKGDHDLRQKTRLACELRGEKDRYVFFHPAFSEHSVRLDPLKNWHRATELASRVAALIPSETKADPFAAFGWMALNSIIQGLVYLDREPNLLKLRRYVEGSPEDLLRQALQKYFIDRSEQKIPARLLDQIKKYQGWTTENGQPEPAIDGLITSYLHNREHFQKMIASLLPILSMLTAGDLRYLLSPMPDDGDPRPGMDLATIIEKNRVLYIGLDSLSDAIVGSAIGSILIADLTAVASDRYNYSRGEKLPAVNVFIDEAAEVVNDPAIQLLNKSRGAGFRVVIATQTLADLEVRTGTEAGARQVIGNTNNWIFLRVIDGETQKYIAEALPKTAVKKLEQGYRSASPSENPITFTGTYTESLSEDKIELFPPALLGILPDLHYFCRFADGTTWKGKLPILEYREEEH